MEELQEFVALFPFGGGGVDDGFWKGWIENIR